MNMFSLFLLCNGLLHVHANPFEPISEMYVNPTLSLHIDDTLQRTTKDSVRQHMEDMKLQPSAYWMDSKNKIFSLASTEETSTMEGILDDMVSGGTYKAVAFIVYDLPNRDCKALASNGEICCNTDEECNQEKGGYCNIPCQKAAKDCVNGLEDYKANYISPMASLLSRDKYEPIRKVLIIEPDSLPNCVTNVDTNGCTDVTCDNYKEGIRFAIHTLSTIPNVYLYLDAAHGGWLGWENTLQDFALLLSDLPTEKVRGFVTNTANYQILGKACHFGEWDRYYDVMQFCEKNRNDPCCDDPCGFHRQFNAANNELNYAQLLRHYTSDLQFATEDERPMIVIDTGRNGNRNARLGAESCKAWCNINKAHIGQYPTTDTDLPYVEAYAWLKTPGESDGCIDYNTQKRCKGAVACTRYDELCGTLPENIGYSNSQPCPPEAGQWFEYQIMQLNDY